MSLRARLTFAVLVFTVCFVVLLIAYVITSQGIALVLALAALVLALVAFFALGRLGKTRQAKSSYIYSSFSDSFDFSLDDVQSYESPANANVQCQAGEHHHSDGHHGHQSTGHYSSSWDTYHSTSHHDSGWSCGSFDSGGHDGGHH
jgi:uncharacterized membrane protein